MKLPCLLVLLFFTQVIRAQEVSLAQPYYITPRTGNQHVDVMNDWELGYTDAALKTVTDLKTITNWIKVAEPTTVQIALTKAGKLPHPYYNLNAKEHAWVDKKVWYYRKQVQLNQSAVQGKYVFLCFDGLDYFAKIWLNGQLLGTHEGMFGGPAVEVSKLVKTGGANELVVEVRSANYGNWDKFDYRKPGRIIKSIDQAGGEGSKPFFALGMWRKVRFELVPPIHIERPFITTKTVSPTKAVLSFETEVFVRKHSLNYQLHPWTNQILTRGALASQVVKAPETLQLAVTFSFEGKVALTKRIPLPLIEGRNWVSQEFTLDNRNGGPPKLWMPVGLGQPNRYQVSVALVQDNAVLDKIRFEQGIRTIETVQSRGIRTDERWDKLQFVVNNQPLFVKGVNWMPADALLDLPPHKYRWLLGMAKDAGIQMIRAWGGGLIETDEFYDVCDSLGLMVWQDFPVWHQDTPDRPQEVWEAQVLQSIFRLRNRASLALYCGGNGFNPYSSGSVTTIGIVERNLKRFDPTRPFIPTTSDAGNVHTYPDLDPARFAHIYRHMPFLAEAGIHSVQDANSLKEIISTDEFSDLGTIYDKDFATTHPQIISHFAEYYPYRVPRMVSRASHITPVKSPTLESLSEASQIGAGEFYQVLSDGFQANYPTTTGMMPWVFNRPWPVFSGIMLVDGFNHPTASYYFLKRTYEPVHIALELPYLLWSPTEKMAIKTALIHNGTSIPKSAKVSVTIYADDYQPVWRQETALGSVGRGTGVRHDSLGTFTLPEQFRNRFFFVVAELTGSTGTVISRSVYWPRCLSVVEEPATRKLLRQEPATYDQIGESWIALPNGPWLKPTAAKVATTLIMEVLSNRATNANQSRLVVRVKNTGKVPSFMTQLDITGAKRAFYATDNFTWLAPGESKEIAIEILWRGSKEVAALTLSAWNATGSSIRL